MSISTDVQRRGKEFFATWSPHQEVHRLSDEQLDVLVRVADVLVPEDPVWVAPSGTEIRSYIARAADRKSDVQLLGRLVDAVAPVLGRGDDAIAGQLALVQAKEPTVFRCLLEFVYCGYYAQPEVVRTIREALNCDYISPPQPRGYAMRSDDDPRPAGKRTWLATQDIRRVDLSGIDLSEKEAT